MYGELLEALAENDAFNSYLARFSVLSELVTQKVSVIERTCDSSELPDLMAGRDAVASLHGVALEGGFQALAQVFYGAYERYCDCLMGYL
jgi:hypothetical protein